MSTFPSLTQGLWGSHSRSSVSNQCISRCLVNLAQRDANSPLNRKTDQPMKNSRRFTLAMATVALVLYAARSARSDELQVPSLLTQEAPAPEILLPGEQVQEEWAMEIQPAIKLKTMPSLPVESHSRLANESGVISIDPSAYSRIYNAIPFNRAEYEVNPNYRHDSTMEILTGNARHQTIVRHSFEHKQPVKRIPAPVRPSRILVPFFPWGLPFGGSFGNGFGTGVY